MALGLQFGPQAQVVLHDAVEHDGEPAGAVGVGMGVLVGGPAVGGPAGVGDAHRARRRRARASTASRLSRLPTEWSSLKPPSWTDGDAGGVVSPVLELAQTPEEDVAARPVADVPDDPTHQKADLRSHGSLEPHLYVRRGPSRHQRFVGREHLDDRTDRRRRRDRRPPRPPGSRPNGRPRSDPARRTSRAPALRSCRPMPRTSRRARALGAGLVYSSSTSARSTQASRAAAGQRLVAEGVLAQEQGLSAAQLGHLGRQRLALRLSSQSTLELPPDTRPTGSPAARSARAAWATPSTEASMPAGGPWKQA